MEPRVNFPNSCEESARSQQIGNRNGERHCLVSKGSVKMRECVSHCLESQ